MESHFTNRPGTGLVVFFKAGKPETNHTTRFETHSYFFIERDVRGYADPIYGLTNVSHTIALDH